jgi:hypothetical protein
MLGVRNKLSRTTLDNLGRPDKTRFDLVVPFVKVRPSQLDDGARHVFSRKRYRTEKSHSPFTSLLLLRSALFEAFYAARLIKCAVATRVKWV